MNRVVFTGGGTAGHVVPAFPLIQKLLQEGVQVSYVGTRSGLEEALTRELGIHYYGISSGKLRRYFSWQNFTDVFRVLAGLLQAIVLIRRLRPDRVFSKGGFVSFPVVVAAWLWRVPVVAHESDLTPGLANRLALPFIRTLCVSFPVTAPPAFKGRLIFSGSPIREELLNGSADRGRTQLGIRENRRVLLIVGGSLGADAINEVVVEALPQLLEQMDVVHVCGPGKLSGFDHPGYHPFEFVTEHWGDYLAAADLIVTRAGANSLFEMLALGKPNLLIPLSQKASRGDQIENAHWAQTEGYSVVVQEEALTVAVLLSALADLSADIPGWHKRLARFEKPPTLTILYQALKDARRR